MKAPLKLPRLLLTTMAILGLGLSAVVAVALLSAGTVRAAATSPRVPAPTSAALSGVSQQGWARHRLDAAPAAGWWTNG